jgi:hypothetical protein
LRDQVAVGEPLHGVHEQETDVASEMLRLVDPLQTIAGVGGEDGVIVGASVGVAVGARVGAFDGVGVGVRVGPAEVPVVGEPTPLGLALDPADAVSPATAPGLVVESPVPGVSVVPSAEDGVAVTSATAGAGRPPAAARAIPPPTIARIMAAPSATRVALRRKGPGCRELGSTGRTTGRTIVDERGAGPAGAIAADAIAAGAIAAGANGRAVWDRMAWYGTGRPSPALALTAHCWQLPQELAQHS